MLLDTAVDDACFRLLEEGSSFRYEPSLWPPGANRCVLESADGTVREQIRVPWLE